MFIKKTGKNSYFKAVQKPMKSTRFKSVANKAQNTTYLPEQSRFSILR